MITEKINLIFDCDGTLIDSYGAISDRICRLFEKHGIICSRNTVKELCIFHNVGYCIDEIAEKHCLDKEALHREYEDIIENLSLITLYPHVMELLSDERFSCFVYTHRGESCRQIFDLLGITGHFIEIVDDTYHFKRKPDREGVDYLVNKYGLDRNRTYYVGDRIIDILCGCNADVGTVFFNSSGLEIDTSDADFVISNLKEIQELKL